MKILGLEDLPWDKLAAKKKRIFCRVDYNVPMKGPKILDDYRIRQTIPTIEALLAKKAVVVLASHLGRPSKIPEADRRQKLSLLPIAERLAELMGREIIFSDELTGSGVRKLVQDAKAGEQVILLENLRFHEGEEKDDAHFAEKLFENFDIYINDAFGASHRAHASIHAVALRTKARAMGLLLEREFKVLKKVLESPVKPQMAVLGGAKITDKIAVIEVLMKTCQKIFIGGRMGLSFLAAKGLDLGGSRMETSEIQLAKRLSSRAQAQGVELFFPIDGKVGQSLDATESSLVSLKSSGELGPSDLILDIGPETLDIWKSEMIEAKSVIWNGPVGVIENPVFAEASLALVDYFAENANQLQCVAGGGETVAAITERGARDKLFHVSTGGGAMLEFIEGKSLPGLEVLKLRDREIAEIANDRMAS